MLHELNIRIVRTMMFRGEPGQHVCGGMHPYTTVCFVAGGVGSISIHGETTELLPGVVCLIPPYLRYDVSCDTAVEMACVDLYAELLPGFEAFAGGEKALSQQIKQEHCISVQVLCGGGIRERLALRAVVELILATFMKKEPEPVQEKMAAFSPMMAYIQQELSARLQRDELAKRFGWKPAALSRAFKQASGFSLKQYMDKLLSAKLAEELLLTEKTLQELADTYGFCDEEDMSAFFRRAMGIKPLQYREAYRYM